MPPATSGWNPLLERTQLAAKALDGLCTVGGTTAGAAAYLKIVASVSDLVVQDLRKIRANKEQLALILTRIHEIICVLVELSTDEDPEQLQLSESPELLNAIASFSEFVARIGLTELDETLRVFTLRSAYYSVRDIEQLQMEAEHKHIELLKLISATDHVSLGASSEQRSLQSSTRSIYLPSAPQVFHGRQPEVDTALALLLDPAPRIAILGPGGIGKTAFAKFLLHHPSTAEKYTQTTDAGRTVEHRYFVSCEASPTLADLVLAVAKVLGVDMRGGPATILGAVYRALRALKGTPVLLVLDNFETPWEPTDVRPKVEGFLAKLAEMDHVALLVTMRGQERASSVQWSRPFLAPLNPLDTDAAVQIFDDIVGVSDLDPNVEEQQSLGQLLVLTGNVPLAVTLMAHASIFEGCTAVLRRYEADSQATLLSDGFDRGSSLELSLRVSLSSPRLKSSPGALQLLSLLSLLPDGTTEADLITSKTPIINLLHSKTALLRTSLAYMQTGRLRVLPPIRELMSRLHPPKFPVVNPLRIYLCGFVEHWKRFALPADQIIYQLIANTANITSLLKFSLAVVSKDDELKDVIMNILTLGRYTGRYFNRSSPLIPLLPPFLERLDDDELWGRYTRDILLHAKSADEVERLVEDGCRRLARVGEIQEQTQIHDVACSFYLCRGDYPSALRHAYAQIDIGQTDRHFFYANCRLAMLHNYMGKYRIALDYAQKAQSHAQNMGNFSRETVALIQEATALAALGSFSRASELAALAHRLVIASGLSGSRDELEVLELQGTIGLYKTDYPACRKANEAVIRIATVDAGGVLYEVNSIVAIASIDVTTGALNSEAEVVAALERPRQVFAANNYPRGAGICDAVLGKYLLLNGDEPRALRVYDRVARMAVPGMVDEDYTHTLRALGDISLHPSRDVSVCRDRATVHLAFAGKQGSVREICWALRLLGDIFRIEGDVDTASTLFAFALEEFTRMGVYQGRAECLVRLAELGSSDQARTRLREAEETYSKAGLAAAVTKIVNQLLERQSTRRQEIIAV
uniref:AAA+ ATPase domain-containing protein n=1 Tax=Mycena chlorophos TaxID=658473 RepID=A0ABQ0LFL0_MYCCL|nr:predicted protein [Mycena chlorophos]